MATIQIEINGINMTCKSEDVDMVCDFALQCLKSAKSLSMDEQIRWIFVEDGKIPAVKAHRSMDPNEPSLLESKNYVEALCADIEHLGPLVRNKEMSDLQRRNYSLNDVNDRLKRENDDLRRRICDLEAQLNDEDANNDDKNEDCDIW